ncbi:Tudor domain-containing protein 3 [Sesamum alatum]|uniref:Tudor domain-containing protein 3 n=1 Tax=Sesamum alatum TaxID=300844 RepID=A0AAE1XZ63_9LAMI|nr:Tudor domain-containing protein 3 [Sesamum alatum]
MDATAITPAAPSSSSSSDYLLLRALIDRGWHFKDMDRIRGLIKNQLSLPTSVCTVDSIESELLNMDLRSIGGKCLPEPSLLRKTSHLQGPIVLQVCSSRDISRSCLDGASGNSGNRRLLRLELTDGHSRITAVEYSHVPSVPEDVIPGTKVQLRSKADICSGILCLNKKVIAILGGVVQSLYEEWKLKRKYMDVSRHTLGLSQENASSGPPPFEKLDIRAPVRGAGATKGKYCSSEFSGSSSNEIRQSLAAKVECSNSSRTSELQKINASVDSATDDIKLLHTVGENKEKPTCSSERSKVIASEPVQNQAAAQKLLQKTSQPNF